MLVEFELCRDARLLNQYYDLREQCFRTELGIPGFDGSEEEMDRQGQIVIARAGNQCIGGARISPRVPIENQLQELELELKLNTCCMWERFAIDPTMRSLQLVRDFCTNIIEFSRMSGFQYALVLSSLRNARFYRQCHSALGIGFQIHRQVPDYAQGAFAGLEHYLSVSNLHEHAPIKMAA